MLKCKSVGWRWRGRLPNTIKKCGPSLEAPSARKTDMDIHMHTHTCIHKCLRACPHTTGGRHLGGGAIHVYMHVSTHMSIDMSTHMSIHMSTPVSKHACKMPTHTHLHTHVYVRVYTCIYTHLYMFVNRGTLAHVEVVAYPCGFAGTYHPADSHNAPPAMH